MIQYILLIVSLFILVACGWQKNNSAEIILPEADPTKYQVERELDPSEFPEADPTKYQVERELDPSEFPEADPTKYQAERG